MSCNDVQAALAGFGACTETEQGSRITTHCLYPSFDPVNVFVVRFGDGFRVHDAGGAFHSSWLHGRDESLIRRMMNRYAGRFQVTVAEDSLVAKATDVEWLTSAILAVANASAATAHAVVEHAVAATELQLKDKILSVLKSTIGADAIATEYVIPGKSTKSHRFDFAVRERRDGLLLINAVAPHHVSVAAKYVAFADIERRADGEVDKFAVHDRPLEASDVSLLQQVADIVPFSSLAPGVRRALAPRVMHR